MTADRPGIVRRCLASVEVKLILAWLAVIATTIALDPGQTYLNSPGSTAELIIRNTVFLGFFALGSAVIIISGGIDLSSGSVIALSATVFSSLLMLIDPEGFRAGDIQTRVVIVAIIGTLVAGVMIGTLNAWLITCVGLPPFIATQATMVGLRRVNLSSHWQSIPNRFPRPAPARFAQRRDQRVDRLPNFCGGHLVPHEPNCGGPASARDGWQ